MISRRLEIKSLLSTMFNVVAQYTLEFDKNGSSSETDRLMKIMKDIEEEILDICDGKDIV